MSELGEMSPPDEFNFREVEQLKSMLEYRGAPVGEAFKSSFELGRKADERDFSNLVVGLQDAIDNR